jgi:hypothetical protein
MTARSRAQILRPATTFHTARRACGGLQQNAAVHSSPGNPAGTLAGFRTARAQRHLPSEQVEDQRLGLQARSELRRPKSPAMLAPRRFSVESQDMNRGYHFCS